MVSDLKSTLSLSDIPMSRELQAGDTTATDMTATTLGARICQGLAERGVEVVFGVPGIHNIELYRGLEASGLRHVLARHEQGAGFMAIGYAAATGNPGVAFVITGPGLCNVMTPMGQAYSDSVPLLVISSCLDPTGSSATRGRLHEMKDQEGAAETVCAWSATAYDSEGASGLLQRAFRELAISRPRPIHIQVPVSALAAPASPLVFPSADVLSCPPEVSSNDVQTVAQEIGSARKPIFIFGGGAHGADESARAVVDRSQAAVFTTLAGKGIIPGSHGRNFGATLSRPQSQAILADADLVVVIGAELGETDLWREQLGHRCPLIRIDIDPGVLADSHSADLPLLGDAARFLRHLDRAFLFGNDDGGWDEQMVRAARDAFRASADAARPGIARAADVLVNAMGKGALVFSDMTQFAYVGRETALLDSPGRWHHPSGFGALGYALPAAIGASLAPNPARVIAVAGDYGFQYTLPELATAVELGLGLPIVVWDNAGLKEIEDAMVGLGIPPSAVGAPGPDFGKLAEAYGAGYRRPRDLTEFDTAVVTGLASERPTLVHLTPPLTGT